MQPVKSVIAWCVIIALIASLSWIFFNELQLCLNYDYTIATIRKKGLDSHFQPDVSFDYIVDGKIYKHSASWNRKAIVGERYIVKYAVHAPHGFKLLFDQPVPDTIDNSFDKNWDTFLKKRDLFRSNNKR